MDDLDDCSDLFVRVYLSHGKRKDGIFLRRMRIRKHEMGGEMSCLRELEHHG